MPKISQTYFSLANVTPTILMLSSLAGQPVLREIPGADGLLLSTPEYNNGIPGVFKNAIDWASRPASDIERVFGGKKAALMGPRPDPSGPSCRRTTGFRSSVRWE